MLGVSLTKHSYAFELDLALEKGRKIIIIREQGTNRGLSTDSRHLESRKIQQFERPSHLDQKFIAFIVELEEYIRELLPEILYPDL